MGLLNIFKKTDEVKIDLLEKREQKVGICLAKKTDTEIKAQVNFLIDISGSMSSMFGSGEVQKLIEKIFPIALKLDIDKELNIWVFNNSCKQVKPSVIIQNFDGYVDKYINWLVGGCTSYCPVLKDVINNYKTDMNTPILNIMITDGDNDDQKETELYIKEISNKNHFWSFCGIGNETFSFLEKLDTMQGRFIDNASFFKVKNINKISDEQLYNFLLSEFPDWIKKAKSKNIL